MPGNTVTIKVRVDDKDAAKLDLVAKRGRNVEKSFLGMNATMLRSGAALAGVGLSAGVAVAGLKAAIGAASSLAEAQSKVNVVFGESADVISDFAKTTATAIGLSERATLMAAGAFGNMFNTIGLARAESAAMSNTMVQLAADMASFNDEDPSQMLLRLRSGLAGEAEPLRRFGVLLSAARVEQAALALGISDGTRKLTEQEKVMARYAVILQDTSVQQGDFARTSEGLANKSRILSAKVDELAVAIGKRLVPATITLVDWLITATAKTENFIDAMLNARIATDSARSGFDALTGQVIGAQPSRADLEGRLGLRGELRELSAFGESAGLTAFPRSGAGRFQPPSSGPLRSPEQVFELFARAAVTFAVVEEEARSLGVSFADVDRGLHGRLEQLITLTEQADQIRRAREDELSAIERETDARERHTNALVAALRGLSPKVAQAAAASFGFPTTTTAVAPGTTQGFTVRPGESVEDAFARHFPGVNYGTINNTVVVDSPDSVALVGPE